MNPTLISTEPELSSEMFEVLRLFIQKIRNYFHDADPSDVENLEAATRAIKILFELYLLNLFLSEL